MSDENLYPQQSRLKRIRPPRVRICYKVELTSGMMMKELPFVVGVLADLSGKRKESIQPFDRREFLSIDRDNFNDVMRQLSPRLLLEVMDCLKPETTPLRVELTFQQLQDFGPTRIVEQVPVLNALLVQRPQAPSAEAIREIDQRLSAQVRAILHHPDFQRLEAAWRGLFYLVDQTETSELLKIQVLDVSKQELMEDMEKADRHDASMLYQKLCRDVYGVWQGEPYGLLVGDYEFSSRGASDVHLLTMISRVAAAAHAPFVAAASPKLFGFERFDELSNLRDLATILERPGYASWRAFRESEESRYVALILPRVLARRPYGNATHPIVRFEFEERTEGQDPGEHLWMSAAWAYAVRVTDAFAKYGWLARTRGVEGGGKVEGLPTHTFPTDDGGIAMKCPTEIAITDPRENELSNLGFMPLIHCRNTDFVVFFGAQSCHKPKEYSDPNANAHAQLLAKLNWLLCLSRFAHYLKCIVRDKIGGLWRLEECEQWLNDWLKNYVVTNPDDHTYEDQARYLLRQGRVEVREREGKPGYFLAVVWLELHFQLEFLTIPLRIEVELPARLNG